MISIIIPTYNEAAGIKTTIQNVFVAAKTHIPEIIVVDGGSSDETMAIAKQAGAMAVKSERKGRAAQMNNGVQFAKHDILYFLHADSTPPVNFISKILTAIENGAKSGCFRLKFDHEHWFLNANAWFTRFNVNAVRFGDQSLFVLKDVFKESGGFQENLVMMEDQEIIHRLKQQGKFKVLNDVVITSARKYRDNGVYRMQGIFFRIWIMYYLGYSQEKMLQVHRKLIRKNKL